MQFCAAFSFIVTIWLLFVKEDKESDDEDLSIKSVYITMWNICKLKRKSLPNALCVLSSHTSHRRSNSMPSAPLRQDRLGCQ